MQETWGFAAIGTPPRVSVAIGESTILLEKLVADAPSSFEELFSQWDRVVAEVDENIAGVPESEWDTPASDQWRVPTVDRPAIYCAGANYLDHLKEMGAESAGPVFHFTSPPGVLSPHGADVVRPRGVDELDWEVELTAVVKRDTRFATRDDALDAIAGFTVANDVSARGDRLFHPIFGVDWMFGKNGEGMTCVGPSIVPARATLEPNDLELSLEVDGVVRQHSRTSQMIHDLVSQIVSLSGYLTLRPGDLILTGTPAGTAAAYGAYLSDGAEMTASIAGVGRLRNRIAPSL